MTLFCACALFFTQVSSFWNSSTSSPSGPLKKAIRIGIGVELFRVTSRVSTVTSAPAFLADTECGFAVIYS